MGTAAAVAGGAALAGAVAGGSPTSQTQRIKRSVGGQTRLGAAADESLLRNFGEFEDFLSAGPGQEALTQSVDAQNQLADLLQNFSQGGFLPSEQDFETARQFTDAAFAAEQESLNQSFEDEEIAANRLASQLGRPVNDPILRARLAQSRTRQQSSLDARRTAQTTQEARGLPLQRLGFLQDFANVRGGLASQAFNNRQTLLQLGQSIGAREQNFRIGQGTTTSTQTSNPGLGGAIGGALSGAGIGLGLSNQLATGSSIAAAGGGGGLSAGGGPAFNSGRFGGFA